MTWPIHKTFKVDSDITGTLAEEAAKAAAKKLVPRLTALLHTRSSSGTPLGEMLAVAARQCTALGGRCSVYLFTDGEWADRHLHLREGVTAADRRWYVRHYAPRLKGLAGASVYFVGVGYGTKLREDRLAVAQRIATALVRAAGGRVRLWNVRLPGAAIS